MTEELIARRPNRAPIHPGLILKEEVLPALDMSVVEVARTLDISRNMLYKLLNQESSISVEMALKIGKLAGNGADIWLKMQMSHDLWYAEQKLEEELDKIPAPDKKLAHA